MGGGTNHAVMRRTEDTNPPESTKRTDTIFVSTPNTAATGSGTSTAPKKTPVLVS